MQPQPPPADRQPFILVIDSPHAPAQDVHQTLVQSGYLPLGPVSNLADALALARLPAADQPLEGQPSVSSQPAAPPIPVAALVVLDNSLPDAAGPEQHPDGRPGDHQPIYSLACERLQIGTALQTLAGLPVFYLAGDIPAVLVERLTLSEAQGFISRPVQPRALRVTIEMALQSRRHVTGPQVRQATGEKDTALLELHHRMRNSLQIIASLLALQEDLFDDLSTRKAFQNMRRRLEAITLVHTPRYQAAYSSSLDLGAYLTDLTGSLAGDLSTNRVNLQTDLTSLLVPASIVASCGLIVYELLANARQHAFPGRHSGTVQVWLRPAGQRVSLGVADDGVGFPGDFDYRRDGRLGLQIVQALVEYQLRGDLVCYNQPGLRWEIHFNPDELTTPTAQITGSPTQ